MDFVLESLLVLLDDDGDDDFRLTAGKLFEEDEDVALPCCFVDFGDGTDNSFSKTDTFSALFPRIFSTMSEISLGSLLTMSSIVS